MSRPRRAESSRTARVFLTLAVALLALAVIAVTPRLARAAFDPVFPSPELFDMGGQAGPSAAGDLNGDGLPDLVVSSFTAAANGNPAHGDIAILLHYGTAMYPVLYRSPVIKKTGSQFPVHDVKLVDMNKDGKLDAVLLISQAIYVMLGNGAGDFGPPTIYTTSATIDDFQDILIGDINGDGWPDVVIESIPSGDYVLMGTGGGALGAATQPGMAGNQGTTLLQDATGDGNADFVAINPNGIMIWPGSSTGVFGPLLPTVPIGLDPSLDDVSSIACGDLNGDSVPDLVYSWTTNYNSTNPKVRHYGVLLGTGGGGFQAPAIYPSSLPVEATWVLLADVDGDGSLDVVGIRENLGYAYSSTIEVAKGTGTGALGAESLFEAPSGFYKPALVDVDEDGKPDMAMSLLSDGTAFEHRVAVVRNNGSGRFQLSHTNTIGPAPTRSVVADFNRDGKPDLAVADSANYVTVATGDGSGAFTPGTAISMPNPVKSMTAGDLDRNGTVDLVTGDGISALKFLSGVGDGSLLAPTNLPGGSITPYTTYARSMADINGDGRPDLVVADPSGDIVVLTQTSLGTFNAFSSAALGAPINDLVLGDWNRDGYLDLAAVVSTGLNEGLWLILGGPTGLGTTPRQVSGGLFTAVCAGDFNRDGNLDLAVRQSWDGVQATAGIFLFTGDGLGGFVASSVPTLDQHGYTIEAADVNHDGRLDLVVEGVTTTSNSSPDRQYAEAEVHLGYGDGTFDEIPYSDGLIGEVNPVYGPATVADVDRDATPDVIASISVPSDIQLTHEVSILHINSSSKGNGLLSAAFFPTVSHPRSVAVGDLNRDGKLDVVTCTPDGTSRVAVHLGNGNGSLGASSLVSASPTSRVAVADFNHDGIPDIATLNNVSAPFGIATLLGTGNGTTFSAPTNYLFNAGLDFAVGDMNRDGIPDIVAATPDSVRVLYGSPLLGRFSGGPGVALPSCSHIELADLNRDGYLDIVCACGSVKVVYGSSVGLSAPVTLPGPFTTCQTLCVADFNRDGFLDIEANESGQWSILWGAAVSPFSTSAVSTLPFAPNDVKEGDAEANGVPYLYAARNPDQVEVLSVSPTGAIASVGSYVVKNQPGALALGDFNRDGGLDVVSASPVDSVLAVNLHGAGSVTAVEPVATLPPAHARLLQNYPNPFNPRTTIRYVLSREERVRLAVYDVRGRLVATLRDGLQAAGGHSVRWDGRDGGGGAVGSGLYFYRLTTESGERESKKMIILK